MTWIRLHLVAVTLVVLAAAATAGVLGFARPTERAPNAEKLVDVASEPHYTLAEVSKAFRAQGIALVKTGHMPGAAFFTDRHPKSRLIDGFQVTLWSTKAKVHTSTAGPRPMFEKWLGNLTISYGGRSHAFAARVGAVADDLAR